MFLPVAAAVYSQVYPRFPLDGTMRPERPAPSPASPQTHVTPFDTLDAPAPAPWPC